VKHTLPKITNVRKPLCVVKQLRLANHNPALGFAVRRLFNLEAETLEKLGKQSKFATFAYFEENEEFYLVQELIVGHPCQELHPANPFLKEQLFRFCTICCQL